MRTTVRIRHCHKPGDKFCRHFQSKSGVLHGHLRVKWLKRGSFSRHIHVVIPIGSASGIFRCQGGFATYQQEPYFIIAANSLMLKVTDKDLSAIPFHALEGLVRLSR